MKKYSMLQAPFLSFFSKPFYEDVAANWTGVGFVYLLLMLTILWALVTARVCIPFAQVLNEHAPKYLNQLPKITVANDKIAIDKPSPWQIKDPDSGAVLVLFDTSGSPAAEKSDVPIIVTATEVIVKGAASTTARGSGRVSLESDDDTTKRFPVAGAPPFEMSAGRAMEMVRLVMIAVPIFVYFFGGCTLLLLHFVQVLVYAGIGMIFAAMLDTKIPYSTAMRLAAMAITPNMLLSTLFSLALLNLFPFWQMLSVVLALGYLFFACKCARAVIPAGSEN